MLVDEEWLNSGLHDGLLLTVEKTSDLTANLYDLTLDPGPFKQCLDAFK